MNDPQSHIYKFDNFRLCAAKRLLLNEDDEIVPLMPKAFDTLLYLVKHNGKVIEKDELMREIWSDTIVEENNLTQNISILRRMFGEKPGEHRFIVTVPGHGYKFVADVQVSSLVESESKHSELQNELEARNLKSETSQIQNRKIYAFAALILLITGTAVFYFWQSAKKTVSSSIKTIAVLPFKSLNVENRNEALELGMADTLISKLGGEEIVVRPLGSVSRYAVLQQDSLNIGRELGVETILDGTIQTADNRIRISAQLFRVSDGKQLWSGQFDEKFTDVFSVQDTISERVATALKIRLSGREKKRQTENAEAYQLYMKGRFHLLKATKSETETSVSYFQQAIEADPNYALAYTGLADAYRGQTVGGEIPANEIMPKARAAALRAIELDDQLAEAHANLGHIHFWYDWNWNAAENQHRRALELDPNSPDALQFYAHLLSSTGRHTEALAKIKRAREIDPLNLRVNAIEGMILLHAGQTDEAIAKLQKTLELDPHHRLALIMVARAYIEKGMFAEAIGAIGKARDISPLSSEPIAYGAYALAKSARRAEAQAALNELLKSPAERHIPSYSIALIYNALSESDKALHYLEKAFAEKDVRMVWLKVEPKWYNLQNEPRFIDLMKRMNFE